MLKGRHRPVRVRLRLLLAELLEHWPLVVAIVITAVIALVVLANTADAEPPPTLGVTSAEVGFVAGNAGDAPW